MPALVHATWLKRLLAGASSSTQFRTCSLSYRSYSLKVGQLIATFIDRPHSKAVTLFRRVLAMYSFHRRVRFILAIAALIAISLIIVRA
jgi:hypothetical protein